MRQFCAFMMFGFLIFLCFAARAIPFLTVDNAFQVKAHIISPTQLNLNWTIAPQYHLYSDSISIKVLVPSGVRLAPIHLPPGKVGTDPTRPKNDMEYYHGLSIPVHVIDGSVTGLQLAVTYQGCADAGLCYPPQTKKINLSEKVDDKLSAFIASNHDAHRIDYFLHQQKLWIVLLSFFVFGLLLACTPCVFPMLPILSSIIAHQGVHLTTIRAFIFSLVYVLASAITYACAGIFAGLAGHHLQILLQNEWVIGFSGVIFLVLAMSLFGLYELQLPHRWQNKLSHLSHSRKKGSLLGVALMGIFSSLIISPCVSAPLVGALAYVGETGSALVGGCALFMLGLGMGFPLLIIGTSAGRLLPKSGYWMEGVKKFFGIMLIAMAIWLWSRVLSDAIILALSGILAIYCAVYLGAFDAAATGWPRFAKATGVIFAIYGVSLLLGAVSGSGNIFQPLDQLSVWHRQDVQNAHSDIHAEFMPVKNITQLQQAIRAHIPQVTVVDFSATWCVACQEMKRNVWNNPTVQKYFQENNIQLLQVDLTVADPENQAIIDYYQIVAPPTLLLFNRRGHWLSDATIVGLQSPDQLLQSLQKNINL